jgi:hypothetical protein
VSRFGPISRRQIINRTDFSLNTEPRLELKSRLFPNIRISSQMICRNALILIFWPDIRIPNDIHECVVLIFWHDIRILNDMQECVVLFFGLISGY